MLKHFWCHFPEITAGVTQVLQTDVAVQYKTMPEEVTIQVTRTDGQLLIPQMVEPLQSRGLTQQSLVMTL
jgi:hypothetical protein